MRHVCTFALAALLALLGSACSDPVPEPAPAIQRGPKPRYLHHTGTFHNPTKAQKPRADEVLLLSRVYTLEGLESGQAVVRIELNGTLVEHGDAPYASVRVFSYDEERGLVARVSPDEALRIDHTLLRFPVELSVCIYGPEAGGAEVFPSRIRVEMTYVNQKTVVHVAEGGLETREIVAGEPGSTVAMDTAIPPQAADYELQQAGLEFLPATRSEPVLGPRAAIILRADEWFAYRHRFRGRDLELRAAVSFE